VGESSLDNKQAASLAGLAPIARQSGQWKGKSFIRGGRARAVSSRVESPGGSENAPNQTNRAVDLMQSDRKPLVL
jgi:hypothetical protein